MAISPYRRAVLLNNQGVHQLERGDFRTARDMFLAAMEEIKLTFPNSIACLSSHDHLTSANCRVKWSMNAPLYGDLNIPLIASTSFLFRRALVIIPVSEKVIVATPTPDLEVESAVMIYNCAISLLIDGFVTNTSEHLTRSRQLFEIALAIRERGGAPRNQPEQMLWHAAICNNLGWIHGELCNYGLAAQYFHVVMNNLSAMSQGALERLDLQDTQGFIMNLFWNVHPYGAAAA